MKHLDLFSGIGGFAIAVDSVWPQSEHIFCDNDKFCQAVLKKHWPKAKIYGDIRTLTNRSGEGLERSTRESVQWRSEGFTRDTFILTGGFPCQPFSQAGRRKGTEDDRYLWPEMLRVIREFKPTWVIAENVRGLITQGGGVVFEQVCLDLEGEGYDVQPLVIPAVAVNAPHRRDRVWFIANRTGEQDRRIQQPDSQRHIGAENEHNAPDTTGDGFYGSEDGQGSEERNDGNQTRKEKLREPQGSYSLRAEAPDWNKNWIEVATELCSLDDGLPVKLDGFECTKSQHRAHQLKAYGNSIVPQVAMKIMEAIKKSA